MELKVELLDRALELIIIHLHLHHQLPTRVHASDYVQDDVITSTSYQYESQLIVLVLMVGRVADRVPAISTNHHRMTRAHASPSTREVVS